MAFEIERYCWLKCDSCGRKAHIDDDYLEQALRDVEADGWRIGRDKHLCPGCKPRDGDGESDSVKQQMLSALDAAEDVLSEFDSTPGDGTQVGTVRKLIIDAIDAARGEGGVT